ncbi:MAG: hypothetical protein Q4D51_12265 [Eubacteriales bacterium]|nr:hypothetical protein [Eubacteriales bacterium]
MEQQSLIVEGFVFPSYKEAQIALKEKKNIDAIRERMPLQDANACYDLYTKLIERDVFHTLVGYSFLAELRRHLVVDFGYSEEDITTVVLPKRMEYDKVQELNQGVLKSKLEKSMHTTTRLKIIIFALVFVVFAMFVIAAINPNTGYINTENKVLNKYAAWQEELEQREKVIKEKEEELNINDLQ